MSINEILCHRPYAAHLVATMQLLRFRNLPDYDSTTAAPAGATEETKISYTVACFRHYKKLAASTPSPVCQNWYEQQAGELLSEHANLDKVEPPCRSPRISGLADKATDTPTQGAKDDRPAQVPLTQDQQNFEGRSASVDGSDDDVGHFLTPASQAGPNPDKHEAPRGAPSDPEGAPQSSN